MNPFILAGLAEIIEWIGNWASALISQMGYPGLAMVMFLENVFPPLPSEVILPFAGSMVRSGRFTLLGITLVGMFGSVCGAWVFYALGYWLDETRVKRLIGKYGKWLLLTVEDFERAQKFFHSHGDKVIFYGRMIPMVRSLISIPAGLMRMNPIRFTAYTALGTALWSFVLALTGKILGDNWSLIDDYLSTYESLILILAAVVGAGFILKRIIARSRQSGILKG